MDQTASNLIGSDRGVLTDYLDSEELNQVIDRFTSDPDNKYEVASFTFPVPAIDPLACLEMKTSTAQFRYYWEKPVQDLAIAAGGTARELTASGRTRFQDIADQIGTLRDRSLSYSAIPHSLAGLHLLGGFSFFDRVETPAWKPFGPARLTVPRWTLIREGKLGLLTLTLDHRSHPTSGKVLKRLESTLSEFEQLFSLEQGLPKCTPSDIVREASAESPEDIEAAWIRNVEQAQYYIDEAYFDKIVLAREVVRPISRSMTPTHLLNSLRSQYPSCYNFMIQAPGGSTFLGSSPERLVLFQNTYLLTESLAGSTSRGRTATEDLHKEKDLLNSSKDRQEHNFVTNAIRESLHPFIEEIELNHQPDVKKLKNVQHLFTPVRARLKKGADRFSILEQLHPTPAVGGHPRNRAVPYINRLENFDRGWYAGPIGWFTLNGRGEFAVGIRSTLLDHRVARIYAGCGIVRDSDPKAEWKETNLKLMPILSALDNYDRRSAE